MSPDAAKVIICTGSGRARGLGAGILMYLAKLGHKVVVSDLGTDSAGADAYPAVSDAMREVGRSIEEAGGECELVACDVRDATQVERLFSRTVERFGRVDVLINNAGIGYLMKPFTEVPEEEWRLVVDVNLTGAFLCSQAAARHMQAAGAGRIINIASQAAKSGFPNLAAYVATKHGMVGLTRACACELGEFGITVNAICPNHITTELGEKQNSYYANLQGLSLQQYLDAMLRRIPVRRHCQTEDVAAMVAFLVSDAASFVTGEAINVSGGEEMH